MFTATALAASLGMVADNENDILRLFNADTGVVVASLQGSIDQISGDCALSEDESTGFSSNAGRYISVFQISDSAAGKAVDFSTIKISNAGVDMSLSPDGRLLVSTGAQPNNGSCAPGSRAGVLLACAPSRYTVHPAHNVLQLSAYFESDCLKCTEYFFNHETRFFENRRP